jgi:hypothetical protein
MTMRRVAGFGTAVAAALAMVLGAVESEPAQRTAVRADAGWQSPAPSAVAASGQQTADDAGWQ